MINVYKRDSSANQNTVLVGKADPIAVPLLAEFSFPSVSDFFQLDMGIACLVISGAVNSYRVEIDCLGDEKKHPIPITEFFKQKDAILFITIWNKYVEMNSKEIQQPIAV